MNILPPVDPDSKWELWLFAKLLVDASYNPAMLVILLSIAIIYGLVKVISLTARRPAQAVQEAASNPHRRRKGHLTLAVIGFLVLAGIAVVLMQTTSVGIGLDVLAVGFLLFVIITELLAGGRKSKPAELPANLSIEDIISWKRQEEVAQPAVHTNGTTTVYQHS